MNLKDDNKERQKLNDSIKFCNENIDLLKQLLKDTVKIQKYLEHLASVEGIKLDEEVDEELDNGNKGTTKKEENILLISETKGKVFLPYTLKEIRKIYREDKEKYASLHDVIMQNYTLPFENFKNAPIARFKETFKLARKVEKKSIITAFELSLELMMNYNLHPAIITACKNLDELDIYLDYLEKGETNKFDCFKVVFEVAPVLM